MSSENGGRLDRIEALMLELATASVRHDNEFSRINATFEKINEQQQTNAQQIALNREDIGELKASITELRNIVADYIQGRS